MGCSPRQVALIFASHLVSELRQLAGPQAPDEGIHPAGPPLQAVEQVPEGVSVAQARVGGPQPILVICRKAGQVRQDLQNIHTAEAAVVVADVLVGLVLSKRHRRSSSADGALDSASATAERYGLRDGEDSLAVVRAVEGPDEGRQMNREASAGETRWVMAMVATTEVARGGCIPGVPWI